MMVVLLIFALSLVDFSTSKELLAFPRHNARSSSVCCNEKSLKSCLNVQVDPSILTSGDEITIMGIPFEFSNDVAPHGQVYKNVNDGDEAVISYDEKTKNMFGSLKLHDGRSFAIERCFNGHIWKEYDVASFKPDEVAIFKGPIVEDKNAARASRNSASDNTTIVTYSVMFYYTPEFAAITADIPGYIDQVIAETNQGYENSGIPVRVSRFCIEAATINDIADTSSFLNAFQNMKGGSSSALRNTADAAALLAEDFNSCGVAYLAQYSSGHTISIAQKSCALGYFSFGHELGHNYGAHHNPEVATNSYFSYGHGHLIAAGSASTGRRTILAYNAAGHSTRVNYYSNPSVNYPSTGTPTGVTGASNNAAVITQNRFAFAALGDESATCSDGSSTSSSTTAAPSPSTTAASNSTGCGNCVFPFLYANRIHDRCTTFDGDSSAWCSTTYEWTGSWEYCTSSSCPGVAAPTEQMSANPYNAEGSCCKFKEGGEGLKYFSPLNLDLHRLWNTKQS